jgi:hypothetical protein
MKHDARQHNIGDRREPHHVTLDYKGGSLRHTLMSAVLIGATLVNCLGIRATYADECVGAPVIFDGIQPLTYKRVKGAPEDRAYIFSHYGATCRPGETNQCKARFIVPGDIVAVAKTCGDFAYIQYIGEKAITTGWTQAKSLESWQPVSADEKPTVFGGPDAAEGHERFKLLQGNGIPVCGAYLQRLNRTEFGAPSYCGRPESTHGARSPLSDASVESFVRGGASQGVTWINIPDAEHHVLVDQPLALIARSPSSMTVFLSEPTCSISTTTSSPCFINSGGVLRKVRTSDSEANGGRRRGIIVK